MPDASTTLPFLPLLSLEKNPIPHLNAFQKLLVPYLGEIAIFWWFLWFLTAIVIIHYVFVHGVRKTSDRELYTDEVSR